MTGTVAYRWPLISLRYSNSLDGHGCFPIPQFFRDAVTRASAPQLHRRAMQSATYLRVRISVIREHDRSVKS